MRVSTTKRRRTKRSNQTGSTTTTTTTTKQYDFILVGCGTAGRSALKTLQQTCPTASIAVLDPLHSPSGVVLQRRQRQRHEHNAGGSTCSYITLQSSSSSSQSSSSPPQPLDFYSERATRLDPSRRLVHLDMDSDDDDDNDNDDDDNSSDNNMTVIGYKHAILVATGARGAPPPSYLLDEKAQPYILELRPTVLPFEIEDQLQRPCCTMEQVRDKVLQVAQAGGKVGILGSGFEALDLAILAALNNGSSTSSKNKSRAKSYSSRPSLIFGNSSPLGSCLPSYLSSALTKRLKSKKINIQDRTLIRYVSAAHNDDDSANNKQQQKPHSSKVHLYTAKSYDLLDSARTEVDLVVVAPDTSGNCGSAALPTDEVPPHLEESSAAQGRSWYQTWANLSRVSADDPSYLVCYKDDARIAVNTEMCACSGVFAAGSVAKYANGLNGHADVAGGLENAADAGLVAGLNMARLYHQQAMSNILKSRLFHAAGSSAAAAFFPSQQELSEDLAFKVHTKGLIPVWRSDLRSLRLSDNETFNNSSNDNKTTLAQIGLTALCVGNCDSERFATHGIWWTNQAAQRRLLGLLERSDDDNSSGNDADKDNTARHRQKYIKDSSPIYGLGVVYYLDRTGRIQGVMTWGLPYKTDGISDTLNQPLVEHIKTLIISNGGFRGLDTEADHIQMSNYLAQEARRIVFLSFSGRMGNQPRDDTERNKEQDNDGHQYHQLDQIHKWQDFPRPLHRFTEIRPPNVRSLNVLKRNDGHGHGVLGQDLFDRYDECIEDRPIAKPNVQQNVGFAAKQAQAMYEWNVWEQKAKRWDENESRARPPKEDLLWIRKGDEMKKVSSKETLLSAYNNVIFGGNNRGR